MLANFQNYFTNRISSNFAVSECITCASCPQCSDDVGWASGRASGLWKMGDGRCGHWLVRMEWLVCASVNLPLHHKVQKFSSGTGSPGWSRKKGRKTVVVWRWWVCQWDCYMWLNMYNTCGYVCVQAVMQQMLLRMSVIQPMPVNWWRSMRLENWLRLVNCSQSSSTLSLKRICGYYKFQRDDIRETIFLTSGVIGVKAPIVYNIVGVNRNGEGWRAKLKGPVGVGSTL